MVHANFIEIFASFQGEGPYVGDPMAFVRFQDCDLACRFCDTPNTFKKNPRCRVEVPPFSGEFSFLENPLTPEQVLQALNPFPVPFVSLTGGEPLQQVEFLRALLPPLKKRHRILLETNGVLPDALREVIDWVDVVSMDIKLPSVTGMRPYWEEHEQFLRIARLQEVYVKVVVGAPTDEGELTQALDLVWRVAPEVPFILQPVTPAWQIKETISEERLKHFYQRSMVCLSDVRVIPQVHARLGIL